MPTLNTLSTLISLVFAMSSWSAEPFPAKKSDFLSPAKPAVASLDTAAIRKIYMDGEFEAAIQQLESARKAGLLKSHQDSVFAFKHLGVMYAASYGTIERGKKFMYQLLTIEPSVRIMDMYASDMIGATETAGA